MSIFIYEDDMIQAQQVRSLIEELCAKHDIAYDFIEVTSRAENIIEKIPHTKYVPLYFLDIEIRSEERKGLELAQMIRQEDQEGIIVFVTTHSEFAPLSYEYMVSALTFIDKALPYEERYKMFEQCLNYYDERNRSKRPVDDLVIQNEHTTIRVAFSRVHYIKTDGPHRLALVTDNRYINFYGSLKQILTLDNRLLRCHQSYVVNLSAIKKYDAANRLITLKNGAEIPVSRRLSRSVQHALRQVD